MAFSLKTLSELNGVAGCEDEVRGYILSEIRDKCDNVEVDALGSIIAYKKGKKSGTKLLIGTNIDEVGLIVDKITDSGYIKFKAVGAVDARMLVSKRVVIGDDKVPGVIGMKAVHLTTKEERKTAVKITELYIDIGAKNKKKAQKRVNAGDYIAFDTKFSEIGSVIKGKALDRFGTAALIKAMEFEPALDTYFVFSAQRETVAQVSGRGMITAAYRIKPDFALIVDTVSAADAYKSEKPRAKLGGGAVIEYMDRTSIADTRFTERVALLADKYGIGMQPKTSSVLSSITGAVIAASTGTKAACIGIPCRYARTPVNMMDINDINAVSDICAAVVKESDVIINGIVETTDRD